MELPRRRGPKPRTHYGLPHQQLEENPPPEVYAQLKARAFDFPGVERRPSVISVPGAEALWLRDAGDAEARPEAFMRGNEFAHVHPPEDGSMHMMLPEGVASEVLDKGWGEAHPLAAEGRMPSTLVMVFGPRDEEELDVVLRLIEASYWFARGD